ncbi:acyl-CoA desaturase [Bryobacterales bacterium F-183]|nr:acyl-CoA desaturase [Bryobacterales bacterium F-183]
MTRSDVIPRNSDGSIKISWVTTIAFLVFHIGAIAALFQFSWKAVFWTAVMYWISVGWGIGLGYHRLHTHRSYKAPKWLDYFFAVCGTMTLEGGPIFWVATHRVHHQLSDKEGDPHSPRDGAWWAHILWMLLGDPKHNDTALLSKYAPDLCKDKFYVWLSKYHWLPLAVFGTLVGVFAGVDMLLWTVFLRVTLGLHATWMVNSASHMWGSKRFATRDDSRNNWFVAIITMGEGWHNNHHAHPASARHGLAWYEFDPTWLQIRLLEKLGIVKNVRVAKIDTVLEPAAKAAA